LDTNYGNSTDGIDIGSGTSPVTATNLIDGLQQGTAYHYQVVASNPSGTTSGNDESFTTLVPFQFTSISTQPGQSVLLQGNGSPNVTYSVDESTNLMTWTFLTHVTADNSGLFQFLTTNSSNVPALYLRLSVP
jgi:hypothetical protein